MWSEQARRAALESRRRKMKAKGPKIYGVSPFADQAWYKTHGGGEIETNSYHRRYGKASAERQGFGPKKIRAILKQRRQSNASQAKFNLEKWEKSGRRRIQRHLLMER